jgi:hypothetical protein
MIRKMYLFQFSSWEKTSTQVGPLERANLNHWTILFPKRHVLYFLEKIQKHSNSECSIPSSEPFRMK